MSALPQTRELVPVAELRDRFLELRDREALTFGEVARRVGWLTGDGEADRARVAYALGLAGRPSPRRPDKQPQQRTAYERAVLLAEALGLEPWECGL